MVALIGMPRSGTTWIAKVLDSHPDTYYLHEPDSEKRLELPQIISASSSSDQYRSEIDGFLNDIEITDSLKVKGRLPLFPKSYFSTFDLNLNRAIIATSKVIGRAFKLKKGKLSYLRAPHNHVVVWKSIESAGRVSAFSRFAPEMKMVMLVRHPCAVINSEIQGEASKQFVSSTPIYENWGLFEKLIESDFAKQNDLTIDELKQMTFAERLAWRWLIYFKQLQSQDGQGNSKIFYHHEFCNEPLKTAERMFEFVDLPFDEQTKTFIRETTTHHSDGYYATSKDPKIASEGWKKSMAASDIEAIKRIVTPHIPTTLWEQI